MPLSLEWADKLVRLLDDQFRIPVLNIRFGLDPLIGLVPWVGDLVGFIISALIVTFLAKNGLPFRLVLRMVVNIILDLLIGEIPVIGNIWDFFFKANRKNLQLAKGYYYSERPYDRGPEERLKTA